MMQPLSAVCEIIMGQAPPGKACNMEGVGTPFVKAGEFDERFPAIREWTTHPLKHARSGDVLICVVGATAGKINQGIDCAIGRSVAAIRPDVLRLDSNYLYYFMRQKTDAMRSKSQGLAQGVITRDMIADIEIPLPPLDEQRRIAAILDQADQLSRKGQCAMDRLNQLGQAIFHEMFGDPIANEKGFLTTPLEGLIKASRGISYGIVQRGPDQDEGVPVVRIRDIVRRQINIAKLVRTTSEISKKYRRTLLEGGELLISIRGTVGAVIHVPENVHSVNISREVAQIPLIQGVSWRLVMFLLRSPEAQQRLTDDIKGVAQSGINLSDLRKIPIIQPTAGEIEEFERRIIALEKLENAAKLGAQRFEALFSSLQHRAFQGEL